MVLIGKDPRASRFALALSIMQEEIAGADLLPREYARYRPLLADGLRFFLERLPESRLEAIFNEQMTLGPGTSTARRVVCIMRHVPALHKLGQVVARDRRLSPGFRMRLQGLESLPAQTQLGEVMARLEPQRRSWEKAGVVIARKALAEGSVAIILPFGWHDARKVTPGVFKVLKPGIERLLGEDLAVLGKLGDYLDQDCERYHLPQVDYRETFDTVKDLLAHETNLPREQSNLREAAEIYAPLRFVKVPEVLPFCSDQITAMERLSGIKVGRIAPRAQSPGKRHSSRLTRTELVSKLARALIAHPFLWPGRQALFHADPHAGNLLEMSDGRLGILDWSLTGRLTASDRKQLVQVLIGALSLDTRLMEAALLKLTSRSQVTPSFREAVSEAVHELRWGRPPGLQWLTDLMDSLVARTGVKLNPNLLLFRKCLLTLEGLFADLVPSGGLRAEMCANSAILVVFLEQWIREWPWTVLQSFRRANRNFEIPTRDLLQLLWSAPVTATRWWTQIGQDLLGAGAKVRLDRTSG